QVCWSQAARCPQSNHLCYKTPALTPPLRQIVDSVTTLQASLTPTSCLQTTSNVGPCPRSSCTLKNDSWEGSGSGKLDGVQGRGERRSDQVGVRRAKSQEERGQGPTLEVVWRQEAQEKTGQTGNRNRRLSKARDVTDCGYRVYDLAKWRSQGRSLIAEELNY
ncbi:hypothetical protein NQZ68_031298, partial [Dissostichus eleginoides]